MIYMCGDNDLDINAIENFNEIENIGSSTAVKIVIELDRSQNGSWTNTRRYFVKKDYNQSSEIISDVVESLDEVNMGDPNSLSDFVIWAINNYPAQKYFLIIWDHGAGWKWLNNGAQIQGGFKGVAYDWDNQYSESQPPNDYLTMSDLSTALSTAISSTGINKINLLGFDACLMQMLEVGYEVKDFAHYLVASQEVEPATGWAYSSWLNALMSNPAMSAVELGKNVVNSYYYANMSYTFPTLSLVDLSKLDALSQSVSDFADMLSSYINTNNNRICSAWFLTLKFFDRDFNDLKDFANVVKFFFPSDNFVQTRTQAVIDAVDDAVVLSKVQSGYEGYAYGISIYLPLSKSYDSSYAGISFGSTITSWTNFIGSNLVCQEDNYEDNDELAKAFNLSDYPDVWLYQIKGCGVIYNGDDDYYRIYLPAGAKTINVTFYSYDLYGDIDICLLDSSGNYACNGSATDSCSRQYGYDSEEIRCSNLNANSYYYIQVFSADGDTSNGNVYELKWSYE